jgi:hypothetical protein
LGTKLESTCRRHAPRRCGQWIHQALRAEVQWADLQSNSLRLLSRRSRAGEGSLKSPDMTTPDMKSAYGGKANQQRTLRITTAADTMRQTRTNTATTCRISTPMAILVDTASLRLGTSTVPVCQISMAFFQQASTVSISQHHRRHQIPLFFRIQAQTLTNLTDAAVLLHLVLYPATTCTGETLQKCTHQLSYLRVPMTFVSERASFVPAPTVMASRTKVQDRTL